VVVFLFQGGGARERAGRERQTEGTNGAGERESAILDRSGRKKFS